MQIGNIKLNNNIFLAPMAGVTDLPFRLICKRYGAGFVYSEMVSAKGLYYQSKKTESLLKLHENEMPAAVQIFGSEPNIMADIAKNLHETGASVIDINMGCPAPKITNNGEGSALSKTPKLAGEIVRAVSSSTHLPVTVKIRKGWNDESVNAVEMAKIIEDNGAAAIAIHGRTRGQFYSGKADWDIIKLVKQSVSIPVIGNGDIFEAQDAKNMLNYTGCDAVMIGRGAQGNPFIFRQIREIFENGEVCFFPTAEDKIKQAIEHVTMLVQEKGESRGIKEARKHMAWYIKGLKNSGTIKEEIFKISKLDEIHRCFEKYIQHY